MSEAQILSLTDRAADRVKKLIGLSSDPVLGLRIGITNTGCNGLSYTMDYAKEEQVEDTIYTDKDICLMIDKDAIEYIAGAEMDWLEEGLESRFVFENPNEKGRCGCGSSFHV